MSTYGLLFQSRFHVKILTYFPTSVFYIISTNCKYVVELIDFLSPTEMNIMWKQNQNGKSHILLWKIVKYGYGKYGLFVRPSSVYRGPAAAILSVGLSNRPVRPKSIRLFIFCSFVYKIQQVKILFDNSK